MTDETINQQGTPGIDRLGRSELHYAAADGDAARVARLIAAGMNPALPDHNGWTPLHFACQGGSADTVRRLLLSDVPIDAVDVYGNSPLHKAVFSSKGRGEVIALLRDAGADPLLRNKHGVSPVGLARSIANFDVRRHFADLPDEST